jgi:hypothetical protein
METQKNKGRLFIVPADVVMDVLRIILKNNLSHYLEAINDKENCILIRVFENGKAVHSKDAMLNIAMILSDYKYYLHGDPSFNVSEEDDEDKFIYNEAV